MAQKEPETGPSLELPSLFGRRKRRTAPPTEEPANDTAADPGADTTTIPRTDAPSDPETREATEAVPVVAPVPAPDPEPNPVPSPRADGGPVPAAGGGRRRAAGAGPRLPEVAASTAAFAVGAVVGLLGCVLTYVGLQGCEAVTGTGSCGGPGLLVLVVILVAMVLLGAAILKALQVPEAGNISFLGVGILTVVALVFLVDYLYEPWMFVVVPAVTAVSFALARWVSTLYAEDVLGDDDGMPHHDIR